MNRVIGPAVHFQRYIVANVGANEYDEEVVQFCDYNTTLYTTKRDAEGFLYYAEASDIKIYKDAKVIKIGIIIEEVDDE